MKKIFLFTLLFLASCAPVQKNIQSLPSLSEQGRMKADLLSYLKNFENITSFQGLADIKLKSKGRSYSTSEALQIQLPNRFSLESLDDLGNLLFLLKSDGEKILLQDVEANKKRLEKLSPVLLRQFIPFQTSIANTLGLFFGKLPLPAQLEELNFEKNTEKLQQFWFSSGNTRYLWDDEAHLVTSLEEYTKRKLLFRYLASDFKSLKEKNIAFPHKIWLKDFARGSEMGIHYSQMEINVKNEDAAFEIKP